jgi:DNA polymerase-3 subunit epsilon
MQENVMDNFVSIDFETATGYSYSACAVGIVEVQNGRIIEEFYSLIQPPKNEYWWQNINVHKIRPADTLCEKTFDEIFPELISRINGKTIVAHNESFDRNVLKRSMSYYGLNYHDFNLPEKWECTMKIYRKKGFRSVSLSACCNVLNISLNHHNAMSDAQACAKLYLMK